MLTNQEDMIGKFDPKLLSEYLLIIYQLNNKLKRGLFD